MLLGRLTVRAVVAVVLAAGGMPSAAAAAAAAEGAEQSAPVRAVASPVSVSLLPSVGELPENTLRLYLDFSAPMRRGQVRRSVQLLDEIGVPVTGAFLSLPTELWDRDQRRLTLLFDPGRIKRGVGPNQRVGAPLVAGRRYTLVVSGAMVSARGEVIGHDVRFPLEVGPSLRTPLNPIEWQIAAPEAGSTEPLVIAFDRPMDTGASRRLIAVVDRAGLPVTGTVSTAGRHWRFKPAVSWATGAYELVIDVELEDVAGNTVLAPFDKPLSSSERGGAPSLYKLGFTPAPPF